MKKGIGWMFTGVGLVGLLPALYGILIAATMIPGSLSKLLHGSVKEAFLAMGLFLVLVAGVVFWTGNIRYSFGLRAWWGNRIFWRSSGIYNLVAVGYVLAVTVVSAETGVLVWAPYPLLAAGLSFWVSRNESEHVTQIIKDKTNETH